MQNNIPKSRFELDINSHLAYADYKIDEQKIFINYVFAPPELRGTGAASKLMSEIKIFCDSQKLEITPICSYAVAWLRKNSK